MNNKRENFENRIRQMTGEQRHYLAQQLDQQNPVSSTSSPQQTLAAFIQCRPESNTDSEAIREYLKNVLPMYMVPPIIKILDKLPRMPNSKIDRRRLSQRDEQSLNEKAVYKKEKTTNEHESLLLNIWQDVLQIEQVGLDDNFFEIGGDSIIAIQIVARALTYGIKMEVRSLFQFPTIAELASHLDTLSGSIANACGREREDFIL